MILFFHFLCFLARYVVLNITKSISKNGKKSCTANKSDSVSTNLKEVSKPPLYENGALKFFPPVYIQRYETVALILEEFASKGSLRKVVDFGCAELGFFMYLKNLEGINEILEVDIDEELLERNSFKAAPLTCDYLMGKGKKSLNVYVLAGSIAEYDDYLAGVDTVIGIEVIEHLTDDVLKKMPFNVFNQIKPKVAIFTTPNAEFNSLFPNFTDCRHSDHKFEWTRKEFYTWTQEIIKEYPEYFVKFYGIGAGPEGTENLGCCTQMAVFSRIDNFKIFDNMKGKSTGTRNYKLINHFKYPEFKDLRTKEEKVLHEIQYRLPYITGLPDYYNYDDNINEIPLSVLKEYVSDLCTNEEELGEILEGHGMTVLKKKSGLYLVKIESQSNSDDDSYEEDIFFDEIDCMHDKHESWDDEHCHQEDSNAFRSARSVEDTKDCETYCTDDECPHNKLMRNVSTKSTPENINRLHKQFEFYEDLRYLKNPRKSPSFLKSRLSRRLFDKQTINIFSEICLGMKNISCVCKSNGRLYNSLNCTVQNIKCSSSV